MLNERSRVRVPSPTPFYLYYGGGSSVGRALKFLCTSVPQSLFMVSSVVWSYFTRNETLTGLRTQGKINTLYECSLTTFSQK